MVPHYPFYTFYSYLFCIRGIFGQLLSEMNFDYYLWDGKVAQGTTGINRLDTINTDKKFSNAQGISLPKGIIPESE